MSSYLDRPTAQKMELLQICMDKIRERVVQIEHQMRSISEALENESKSSMGDKYETGRARLQQENDKCQVQLVAANHDLLTLKQIDVEKCLDLAVHGSMIYTNRGNYFFSIGLGKVQVRGDVFYCISTGAPIAQSFLGKSVGQICIFRGTQFIIHEIF